MNVTKDDFVSKAAFEEYERTIQLFYSQLVYLNTTIYVMERIAEFPWSLFGSPHGMTPFFHIVMNNSFVSAILIITKLVTDQGNGPTIRSFRDTLRRDLIRPESRDALSLDERLGQIKVLLAPVKSKLGTIEDIRNQYVAHLGEELIHPPAERKTERVDLSTLVELRNVLNQAFQVLTLKDDTEYSMLPWEYSDLVTHPPGSDPRSDIERILDKVACESALLHAPERDPFWQEIRSLRSDDEMALINHYREKCGLDPVHTPRFASSTPG